jgi:hypothetical protein
MLASVTTVDDGTATGTWPDRFAFWFDPAGASPAVRTGYHNEYGELRARPAKASTVPFRVLTYTNTGGTTTDIFQVTTGDGSTQKYFVVSQDAAVFTVPVTAPNLQPAATWPVVGNDVGYQNISRGTSATMTPALNRHFAMPFRVPVATTLTKVLFEVSVAAAAGGTWRMGLYGPDGLFPGAKIADLGNGVTTSVALIPVTFTAIPLLPNVTYWVSLVFQGNVTSLTLRSRGDNNPLVLQTNASPALNSSMMCQYHNAVSGTLSDPFGSTDGQTQSPEVALWFV